VIRLHGLLHPGRQSAGFDLHAYRSRENDGGALGLFKKLKSSLVGREEDKRVEETRDRTIPIDASVDLAYGNPVAELGPGDLFGEMTA